MRVCPRGAYRALAHPRTFRKSEQLRRIVDQHAPARRLARRDLGDRVDQLAVVGHVLVDVGMRPVGAPDDALGRVVGDVARERDRVAERRRLLRHPVGAAELDPDAAAVEQAAQRQERLAGRALAHVQPRDVVDHHLGVDRADEVEMLDQVDAAHMHRDVPFVRRDQPHDGAHGVVGRRVAEMRQEMEAHAAEAGGVEPRDLVLGRLRR